MNAAFKNTTKADFLMKYLTVSGAYVCQDLKIIDGSWTATNSVSKGSILMTIPAGICIAGSVREKARILRSGHYAPGFRTFEKSFPSNHDIITGHWFYSVDEIPNCNLWFYNQLKKKYHQIMRDIEGEYAHYYLVAEMLAMGQSHIIPGAIYLMGNDVNSAFAVSDSDLKLVCTCDIETGERIGYDFGTKCMYKMFTDYGLVRDTGYIDISDIVESMSLHVDSPVYNELFKGCTRVGQKYLSDQPLDPCSLDDLVVRSIGIRDLDQLGKTFEQCSGNVKLEVTKRVLAITRQMANGINGKAFFAKSEPIAAREFCMISRMTLDVINASAENIVEKLLGIHVTIDVPQPDDPMVESIRSQLKGPVVLETLDIPLLNESESEYETEAEEAVEVEAGEAVESEAEEAVEVEAGEAVEIEAEEAVEIEAEEAVEIEAEEAVETEEAVDEIEAEEAHSTKVEGQTSFMLELKPCVKRGESPEVDDDELFALAAEFDSDSESDSECGSDYGFSHEVSTLPLISLSLSTPVVQELIKIDILAPKSMPSLDLSSIPGMSVVSTGANLSGLPQSTESLKGMELNNGVFEWTPY